MTSYRDQFERRLYGDFLPAFCHDPKRRHDPSGFKSSSFAVTEFDAENFLKAIDLGLVVDAGGGRLHCAIRRSAHTQLFSSGLRSILPRPLTLWKEPIIAIASIARLHVDFDWPIDSLCLEPNDYAFDLAVFKERGDSSEYIAGEIKKSKAEIDRMIEYFGDFSLNGLDDVDKSKRRNSAKKWSAIINRKIPMVWAVGPGGYSRLFRIEHSSLGNPRPIEVDLIELHRSRS